MILTNSVLVVVIFYAILIGSVVAIVVGIGFALKHGQQRTSARRIQKRVEKAKKEILADGVVRGPKGPYVRHKPWRKGSGTVTSKETGKTEEPGYHGTPWPK